jgi:hypothetical protein
MFDIKNAAEESCPTDLVLHFKYWVVFPQISRDSWFSRWGAGAYAPPEFLFADDLSLLAGKVREDGKRNLKNKGLAQWPPDQFACVWRAFGDSSVLYQLPEERESRRVPVAVLGELFDEAAEAYKTLSDEQQRLSSQNWTGGPRLIRGVAGSGKTIVLANNLARRLQRTHGTEELLFAAPMGNPKYLAVCYNRTLAPFIQEKISVSYQQKTGKNLPKDAVEVSYYNGLLFNLSKKGLWRYQRTDGMKEDARVKLYLQELDHVIEKQPELLDAIGYDAIFVDEGQDFLEDDFRLLKGLCRKSKHSEEPNLYVFYDDAQNYLCRRRPNWKSLGLNLVGARSQVMTKCFRNTKAIVETSFNVLYGRFAESTGQIPTKDFGDITTLEEKGLIEDKGDHYEVRYAVRSGRFPILTIAPTLLEERRALIERLRWLIEEQRVRPEDILVLAHSWKRILESAEAIKDAKIEGLQGVHVAKENQDRRLRQRGCLSLSTVASAKGYDAYCTLLVSANDFTPDVKGRATFYVGCTRAIEYLEVFAHERKGLVLEFEKALARLGEVGEPAGIDEKSNGQWAKAKDEIRRILIDQANQGQTIPYTDLVTQIKSMDLRRDSPALWNILGEISTDEDAAGRGMLTVIVVHGVGNMRPGSGFFKLAKKLGKEIPDQQAFWMTELKRVHEYWRVGSGMLRPDTFAHPDETDSSA